jgi:asparagine synthase (glutamine-hydrolysing)
LNGWVEVRGEKLQREKAISLFQDDPLAATSFGGEFFLSCEGCTARDALGIIPGESPAGKIVCHGKIIGEVNPEIPTLDLESAIREAVRLRSDHGVVALSGGVDSALIAALAGLPCLAVGMAGSHDLQRAAFSADVLSLDCTLITIQSSEVEEALRQVLRVIPDKNPVDAAIATTQYFITRAARDMGHSRVLTGQGADELFGGYARYLLVEDVEAQLVMDFTSLRDQGERDQAVAALHGSLLSMPYLDLRVVRASRALPAHRKVKGGLRKIALREVAMRYMPHDLAWREKKAMQYGSGISKEIQRLARRRGYGRVTEYLALFHAQ